MPGADNDSHAAEESAVDSAQQIGGAQSTDVLPVDWDTLPSPIRTRLAELAAAALGDMRQADIPVQLRPVVRFAPAKRAKLGLSLLLAALQDSAVFRTAVVAWCRNHRQEALATEHADPVVVACAGVLLDTAYAHHYVELVSLRSEQGQLRSERDSAVARADKLSTECERLRHDLSEARRAADSAGNECSAEAERLRKRLREQGVRLKEAREDAELARSELARIREETDAELAEIAAQRDKEQTKAKEERTRAERAVAETEVARHSAREARQGDEVRLTLLLETLEGALDGLRRELGASGSGPRPADAVQRGRARSMAAEEVSDTATLERLLALPAVHLIVDGYNVTKTGYPDLPLADQRDRLAHQLASLAARTGAEVTVVFDGADVLSVPTAGPRGVRVLFSEPGVQADDVILSLVEAEPSGRQLIVATSDRAVVSSVRQHGAYPVSSAILVERLHRV